MNTEQEKQPDDNDPIEGIGVAIAVHITWISKIEGKVQSVKRVGHSYYITFDSGAQYIQPLAYKNTNTVTLDTTP